MKHDVKTVKGFLDYIYDLYKEMKNYEINIIYEGKITHQITKAFTALTEFNLEKQEESDKVKRRVFHVMVESLQNISKHASPSGEIREKEKGRGIFVVTRGNEFYTIITGNLTSNESTKELTDILEKVNSLNKEELKELYKKQIKNGSKLSDRGGAGLGFIDIARKTGNPINYNIIPMKDNINSFFILGVKINIQ